MKGNRQSEKTSEIYQLICYYQRMYGEHQILHLSLSLCQQLPVPAINVVFKPAASDSRSTQLHNFSSHSIADEEIKERTNLVWTPPQQSSDFTTALQISIRFSNEINVEILLASDKSTPCLLTFEGEYFWEQKSENKSEVFFNFISHLFFLCTKKNERITS